MENRKRNQHYVFKNYLESWHSENSKLWCARLVEDKYQLFQNNGKSIAVERDFYKVNPMNCHEEIFVRELVKVLFQGYALKDDDIMQEIYSRIRPTILKKDLRTCSEMLKERIPNKSEEIDQKLSEILDNTLTAELNWLEDWHCIIENSGIDYINKIKNKDLDFYSVNLACPQPPGTYSDDENFKFLHFVSVQALRTKKSRVVSQDIFKEVSRQHSKNIVKINIDNIQDVFTHFQQLKLALDLRQGNVKVTIVENETELPFVTSDQPVVVKTNFSIEANDKQPLPQLYYPISPAVAVLINSENLPPKLSLKDKTEIDCLNKLMYNFSHEMIFANEKGVLEKLIQENK